MRDKLISMGTALTKNEIINDLHRIGLKRGAAVEVHSSLSRMGIVEGGALTVIDALMDVVGIEGTIVMSAYRVTLPLPLTQEEKKKGIIAKVRLLDEDEDSKTGMGIIADTFCKLPGTFMGRGDHPVCAWGRDADLHSRGYEHLLSVNGWVLLIGVDITRCSCMHTAEEKIKIPEPIIKELYELPEEIQRQYPDDQWYVQYHDPLKPLPDDAWIKVQTEAERRWLILRGKIGKAESMLFRGKPVVDIYEEFLRTDPYELFGVKNG